MAVVKAGPARLGATVFKLAATDGSGAAPSALNTLLATGAVRRGIHRLVD